ncbi:MAG: FeoB-associated Cys-rich membrane protein [Spirochaetaceae bacterium]|nr:FeoB-associated Cys-rich membrane protein [Spirochaetaceae bacterium]MBP5329198.1 FeoB-associated Cys-rich membrane protein [Spirochaetaceae bacterium]
MGTLIVALILAGLVCAVIVKMVRNKKNGKGCSSCPSCSMCGQHDCPSRKVS